MCNQCARLYLNEQFKNKVILKLDDKTIPHKFTPNCKLSLDQKNSKLKTLAHTIRICQQRHRRYKARGVKITQSSFVRKDIGKFVMELNYIATKGTLDDRKVMWSYLQDVVRSEFLKTRKSKGSRGMRWSQDSKDFLALQKLTSGKGVCRQQRQNIGGPSLSTVSKQCK